MSVVINNNLNALNAARTLNGHYGRLAKSVQRLSSGLRVNSAADDAAGLAIREMMRADIAAMQQGTRNVNDAISMIQTADGAMAVIDEKLIRMKELAEQAATGTYNSTQRLIIDSEFQAMGAEIERIARATDFNGLKILDGSGIAGKAVDGRAAAARAAGAAAGSRASVVGPDGKTYSATVGNSFVNTGVGAITSQTSANALTQGITNPMALGVGTHTITLENDASITVGSTGQYRVNVSTMGTITPGASYNISYDAATQQWILPGATSVGGNTSTGATFMIGGSTVIIASVTDQNGAPAALTENINFTYNSAGVYDPSYTASSATLTPVGVQANYDQNTDTLTLEVDLGNGNVIQERFSIGSDRPIDLSKITYTINVTAKDPNKPTDPNDPNNPNDPNDPNGGGGDIPPNVVKIHFGPGNDSAEDYYYINKQDCTLDGLGLAGVSIETQQKAQEALGTLDDAIVAKDNARAYFGGMQNRLENTLTNIMIQGENLQASESRISDTDVSLEMTNFVKNQILTQSAVAMLAQANSLPQMAMSLIGG